MSTTGSCILASSADGTRLGMSCTLTDASNGLAMTSDVSGSPMDVSGNVLVPHQTANCAFAPGPSGQVMIVCDQMQSMDASSNTPQIKVVHPMHDSSMSQVDASKLSFGQNTYGSAAAGNNAYGYS